RRIGEAKRIQAVERAVGKPGGDRLALDDRQRLGSLGMACTKRLYFVWIRLARLGVRLRRDQLLVKSLGRTEGKHGEVDHGGTPQLAVGECKLKTQAADRVRRVGRSGLPAPK